jgi:hypothetical protein
MKKLMMMLKEIDKFHTDLDKIVHKHFGHSSKEKKRWMKKWPLVLLKTYKKHMLI